MPSVKLPQRFCSVCSNEIRDFSYGIVYGVKPKSVCQACFSHLKSSGWIACGDCGFCVAPLDYVLFFGIAFCQVCIYSRPAQCYDCKMSYPLVAEKWKEFNHNDLKKRICTTCGNDEVECSIVKVKRKYGIEIECLVDESHEDDSNWAITEDSSIISDESFMMPQERVSPILYGDKGLDVIKDECYLLNNTCQAQTNRTCGLHVHVDARKLSKGELFNIAKNYYKFDALIYHLVTTSRYGNTYCKSCPFGIDDLYSLPAFERALGRIDRYHGLNFCAFFELGSLEFRYHQGTIDYEKIKHWVIFCLHFVEYSKTLSESLGDLACQRPSIKNILAMFEDIQLPEETRLFYFNAIKRMGRLKNNDTNRETQGAENTETVQA